jgi:hypothetical protein
VQQGSAREWGKAFEDARTHYIFRSFALDVRRQPRRWRGAFLFFFFFWGVI